MGNKKTILAHSSAIFSIFLEDDLLLTLSSEGVKGWKRRQVEEGTAKEALFFISSQKREQLCFNCATITADKRMFIGANDGYVYGYDIRGEGVKEDAVFSAHSDSILSISHKTNSNRFYTGSEDGTVKIWG